MNLAEYGTRELTDLWQEFSAQAMDAIDRLSAVRDEFLRRGFSELAAVDLVQASSIVGECQNADFNGAKLSMKPRGFEPKSGKIDPGIDFE